MPEFVCIRELHREGSGGEDTIEVALAAPEARPQGGFACAFRIGGLGDSRAQYAFGEDSFQALMTALEAIRTTLDKPRETITWTGGQNGDHGFPGLVPSFYGLEFSDRLNKMIDAEIARFAHHASDSGPSTE